MAIIVGSLLRRKSKTKTNQSKIISFLKIKKL